MFARFALHDRRVKGDSIVKLTCLGLPESSTLSSLIERHRTSCLMVSNGLTCSPKILWVVHGYLCNTEPFQEPLPESNASQQQDRSPEY